MSPIQKVTSADLVWLALVLATLLSAWLAEYHHLGALTVPLVMAVAACKCYGVVNSFMEMHAAPRAWRWAFAAWILGSAVLITVLYVLAKRGG